MSTVPNAELLEKAVSAQLDFRAGVPVVQWNLIISLLAPRRELQVCVVPGMTVEQLTVSLAI